MKSTNFLRRFVLRGIVAVFCLAALQTPLRAEASIITDIAKGLGDIGDPLCIPYGVCSAELIAAESLFTCLADGQSVVDCALEYKEKNNNLDIPPWLEVFIDFYVAYVEGDVMAAIGALMTKEIICVVAQIVVQFDVCGLIEALVAIGEAVYDVATALYSLASDAAEFFLDLFGVSTCELAELTPISWDIARTRRRRCRPRTSASAIITLRA